MLSRLGDLRRGPRRDAGFTLTELLVGMGLTTLLGALALQFFVGGAQQTNRVANQSLDGADARVAAEHIASELRLADSPTARPGTAAGRFEVLTPTRIVFYANLDQQSRAGDAGRIPPTKVDIAVTASNQLVETLYAPLRKYAAVPSPAPTPAPTPYPSSYDYTTNYPTTPTSRSVLVSGLRNTTAVFSYCSSGSDPAVACAATTDPKAIASVGVVLRLVAKTGDRDQLVQTSIAITGAVS